MKFFDSQSEASIQWFLKVTPATKRSTPCERVWKAVPENGVLSCVPFCLRSLGRFARCDCLFWFQKFSKFRAFCLSFTAKISRNAFSPGTTVPWIFSFNSLNTCRLILAKLSQGCLQWYWILHGQLNFTYGESWILIVEIFSSYKYRSIKLRARWQCFRRIYDFSLIYKRVIKLALYDFKMLYPYWS